MNFFQTALAVAAIGVYSVAAAVAIAKPPPGCAELPSGTVVC